MVIHRHWAEILGSSRERTAHRRVTIFKTACYTQRLLCLGTCLALEEKKILKRNFSMGHFGKWQVTKWEKCFLFLFNIKKHWLKPQITSFKIILIWQIWWSCNTNSVWFQLTEWWVLYLHSASLTAANSSYYALAIM